MTTTTHDTQPDRVPDCVTGTFTGEMTMPDGTVIPPTGKAFDVEFGQTVKWDGDQVIEVAAFWDAAFASHIPNLQQFGSEVIPALREAPAAERGQRRSGERP